MPNRAPLTTLICDASFSDDGRAGWGVWMKRLGISYSNGGPFRSRLAHSTEAETLALANGVALLPKVGTLNDEAVILQSDCVTALGCLITLVPRVRVLHRPSDPVAILPVRSMTRAQREACALIAASPYPALFIRHVRGHNPRLGNANYINQLCDNLANDGRLRAK